MHPVVTTGTEGGSLHPGTSSKTKKKRVPKQPGKDDIMNSEYFHLVVQF